MVSLRVTCNSLTSNIVKQHDKPARTKRDTWLARWTMCRLRRLILTSHLLVLCWNVWSTDTVGMDGQNCNTWQKYPTHKDEPSRRHLVAPAESPSTQHVIRQTTFGKFAASVADVGATSSSHASMVSSSIFRGTGPTCSTRWWNSRMSKATPAG